MNDDSPHAGDDQRQGQAKSTGTGRIAEVRDHLADARNLLCLANRKGIRIPQDVLRVVVQADRTCAEQGQIDLNLETDFWDAYGILRRTIQPATRARKYYRAVFYCALAVMLVFQCYFLFGSRVHEQLAQLRTEQIQLLGTVQLLEEGGTDGSQAFRRSAEIEAQLAQNGNAREAYHDLALLLVPHSDGFVASARSSAADSSVERENDVEVALATLKMILDFLAAYLLPALYGLLGACAFVLRQLAADLSRNVGESRSAYASSVRYSLRLNIGVLAGLAVGWFIDPMQEGSVVANLSPLALAFVAGYGSDLVFAVMDRIVTAFTGEANDEQATVASQHPERQQAERPRAAERAPTAAPETADARKVRARGRRTDGNGTAPVNGAVRQPEPAPAG